MLIEFHVLQNHAPSNLNRDQGGSPKECLFGGKKRARISSQCLKRSIRRSAIFQQALPGALATRTRRLPELIRTRFQESGLADYAEVAAKKASGFGTNDGKEQEVKNDTLSTAQTMFLADSDINAVAEVLLTAAREAGSVKKFEAVKAAELQEKARQKGFRPVTPDLALFGRMTTSGAFRDVEASMQVAHALSTHKVDQEFDYFTAVDDLKGTTGEEDSAGADMLGDAEFNSACYYKYFSLDVDGLVKNLTGENIVGYQASPQDRQSAVDLATTVVDAFTRAMAMTVPTGKQNSFAAHQLPAVVLVEVRPHAMPVSYANAFVEPARPGANYEEVRKATGRGADLVAVSAALLKSHVEALTEGFGLEATSRMLLAPEFGAETKQGGYVIEGVARVSTLNELCANLVTAVRGNGGGDG